MAGVMVFCRGCGKEIHETAITCPHCGAPQYIPGGGKNKLAAALLAIFVGWAGIHRFYLGQWWGVFYFLFCWTFIPMVVSFIEGIVFLLTPDAVWEAKYGAGTRANTGCAAVTIGCVAAVIMLILLSSAAGYLIFGHHDFYFPPQIMDRGI